MELINWCIDSVLLMAHVILSFLPPLAGLTCLASAVGAGMVWIFGKASDQGRMTEVKRRIQAGMLELRLFVDEPLVSLQAQRSLLAANLRYLAIALRPALWMTIPAGLLLIHLAAFYERAPLPLGEPAVVTMRMSEAWDDTGGTPELIAPQGVTILGPPVRVTATREVSWRILPTFPGSRQLEFRLGRGSVSKLLEAGGLQRYVPGRIVRAGWGSIFSPGEGALHSDVVEWIEIRYPDIELRFLGVRVNWLVWFLAVSMGAGLILRRRLGVVI